MSLFQYQMQMISTHTLTWSVTYRFSTLALYHANFNSHAHVERDMIAKMPQIILIISTHTLTWSVTLRVQKPLFYNVFQLTRSRGA